MNALIATTSMCGLMPLAEIMPMDIVISICLFLCVAMFIVAIFSQKGEVEFSPQRQSAIESGHLDRRTLFEKPLTMPIMWLLLMFSHRLAMPRLKGWIARNLMASGNPDFYTPQEYMAVSMMTGVSLGLVAGVIYSLAFHEISVMFFLIAFLLGCAVSIYGLHEKAVDRLKIITKRIPYALDLISLAMGAGATFVEAVKTIVMEDESDPFNVELRAMLAEIEYGATRRKALMNMSDRIPLESLRGIVASVIQAEELGTPLSKVLHDQASLLRLQRSVRAENAAAKAGIRILLPCLLLVMAVIIAIFGPAVLRIIQQGGVF